MPNESRPRAAAIPRAIRALRWVLFALLLAAAGAALVGLPRAFRSGWSSGLRLVPVALLLVFVAGYAAYRFALIRAGRYSAGKTFVQVGVMLLAVGVIASIALERPRPEDLSGVVDLAGPLASADPTVRALAAELCRHRPRAEALRHVERLIGLVDDGAPEVRREAHATLVALADSDEGSGPGAAARWRGLWQRRGVLTADR
jgi:hypothetical protein